MILGAAHPGGTVRQFEKIGINLSAAMVGLAIAGAAEAQEIRFMCSSDNNLCYVMKALVPAFEAQNPGITVVTDIVPNKAIMESLPVQLAGKSGPDLATVNDLAGLNRYYLDLTPYIDVGYWTENFGDYFAWFRSNPDDKGIYGMMTQLTLSGAFVNRTLFEQAEIDMPKPGATWQDWATASVAVAKATGVTYPMGFDRSGHRISATAISFGAKMFDDQGQPTLSDKGYADFVRTFVAWNNDGTIGREVWAGQGGTSYRDLAPEFINGEMVFGYSGTWLIQRYDQDIGDGFDWEVVPAPCGPGGCTAMVGGSAIAGFKHSKSPEAVAKFLSYLASTEVYRDFSEQTLNVPAHKGIAAEGLSYPNATPNARSALQAFNAQISSISPVAFRVQGYRLNRAMFNVSVQRITQAIIGEISIDNAIAKMQSDIDEAVRQAN